MIWIESPTRLRCANVPGMAFDPSQGQVWASIGRRGARFVAFYVAQLSSYVAVRFANWTRAGEGMCYSVGSYSPLWINCNGFIAFSDGAGYYIWYSARWRGWVLGNHEPGLDYAETETTEDGATTHGGDSFWLCTSWPAFSNGAEVVFAPRGSNRDSGSDRTLAISWDYFFNSSTDPQGVYAAAGSESGTLTLGRHYWTDGGGALHYKSINQDSTGHYAYGSASYDSDAAAWVIGAYGSAAGWHQSASEPSVGGATVFAFAQPEGGTAEGQPIEFSYGGIAIGDASSEIMVAEASIWR